MKKVILCLFAIGIHFTVLSQTFSDNRTLHYDSKDGLSFGIVNSICQDERGFMWFATSDGLNRFDGSNFKVFKNEKANANSLSGNYIQSVFKDSEGILWVSTREGLNQFDPQTSRFIKYRFSNKQAVGKNDVSHISESRDGNLWVATSNNFYYFNRHTKKYITYNNTSLPGLPSNSILSLYEDTKEYLWIGTLNSGIAVYKVKNGQIGQEIKLLNQARAVRINRIYEDQRNTIWMATSHGLAFYKRDEGKIIYLHGNDYDLPSDIFLSIIENSKGELLVGLQEGGLYRLTLPDGKRETNYSFTEVTGKNSDPLTRRSVQTLFLDKDKNIWVGTYGNGLYMVSSINEKFKKHQIKQPDETPVRFYGMCLDQQGNLWLGTDGSGIYKSTIHGTVLKHYQADGGSGSLTDNAIISALKDSRNRLWFGSYQRGLFLYNSASDNFRPFSYIANNPASLGSNDVRVIYEDSAGRIWVGTNGGGLNLLNPDGVSFKRFTQANSTINSDDIRALCEDKRGNLWVGTYGGGLNYFDRSKNRFIRILQKGSQKNIVTNNVVFDLHLDKDGLLWIGTEGDGLIQYNTKTGKAVTFDEKNGLANNTVNAIEAENENILWVSTNKGLSKLDRRNGKITNYDESDGLQAGQFHEASAIHSNDGKFMVFGGTEGWNIFNPASVTQSRYKPKVLISGLKLFGQEKLKDQDNETRDITEAKEVVLQPDESVFSLNYVMIDYAFPSEGEFAYKLEGLEKEWNYVNGQRSATYRYLAPGDYVFKVKAANHDGVWFNDYSSIVVRVLPPWYKTWWAYLAYIGGLSGAMYWFIRYRTEQAKLKYEIKTAQFEAETEKELHRKKENFFTNISHEFRTPLTLIINPLKEMLYQDQKDISTGSLNVVYKNARRLLSLVDQLLLFRKSESGRLKIVPLNIVEVCREVVLCFTYQAKRQQIDLEFNTSDNEVEIFADREKIEISLFNLLSNALKFTPEKGRVSIQLTDFDTEVRIQVTDTGPGISQDVGDKLFEQFYQVNTGTTKGGFGIGLSLVKNFIEQHKGAVEYSSQPGEGTTFSISLLKGKEHFSSDTIFEDVPETSIFLEELMEEVGTNEIINEEPQQKEADLYTEIKTILVVDDNIQIRQYIKQLFSQQFEVLEADNGGRGLEMIKQHMPDVVISDVMMQELSGIELCNRVKEDPSLSHIPIILLTASSSVEVKLKGIECGADDYISKPFEKEILIARVSGILKSRNNLQQYFYNQITLQPNNTKISAEYKQFLDRCIEIVETHLSDSEFGIKKLAEEIGMSRSNLYLRIKSVSGQSGNSFIRFIRLRKAAEMFLTTDLTISETAYLVGIKDIKYFREQFNKLFGMNPSEYIKRYRKQFNANHSIKKDIHQKQK